MAKKQTSGLDELFQRTEPAEPQAQEQPEDPVRAIGIGLKVSEWALMEEIATEMGVTRHALAMWALRDFMQRYDAGEIQTQTRPTLPGL